MSHRRFVRPIARVSVGRTSAISHIVIRTDAVPDADLLAAGFAPVDPRLSDEEVRQLYGVVEIFEVRDDRVAAIN